MVKQQPFTDKSSPGFCEVTAPFPWVLVHTTLSLCTPRVESLFPQVLWKSFNQLSKTDSLGISSPFAGSPGWEACHGAQNLHNCGRTSVLLFSSLWVTQMASMGFDFTVIAYLLLFLIAVSSLSLDVGYHFLVGSSIFLSMVCSADNWDFGILTEGNEQFLILHQHEPIQLILKEINPEYSLEELVLKMKLQYFGHLIGRDPGDGKD